MVWATKVGLRSDCRSFQVVYETLQVFCSSSNRLEMTSERRLGVLFKMGKNQSHCNSWRTGLRSIKRCPRGNGCKSTVSCLLRVGRGALQISNRLRIFGVRLTVHNVANMPLQMQGWKKIAGWVWRQVTPQYIRTLYKSMPRRLTAAVQAQGSHTKY